MKASSHLEKSRQHLINKAYSSPSFILACLHLETVNSGEKNKFCYGIKILGTTNYKYSIFKQTKMFAFPKCKHPVNKTNNIPGIETPVICL